MYLCLLAVVCLSAGTLSAQTIPPVTGRTFTLQTSANHKLFIPDSLDLTGDDVDVLVHFHGDPATVNNNAGYAGLNAVIVNVTYSGLSGAYSGPFSDSALFGNVMDAALTSLRAQPDIAPTVDWDQLSISSFSAGYGAVREILKQPTYFNQIDGLLLADSLHAGYVGGSTPNPAQMVDFKAFAQAAAFGDKTMLVSHSQISTYGAYASTTETADDLMQHVGVTPTAVNEPGLGTLQFYRQAEVGNFGVWGATGADAAAHTKHLQYMAQWLGDLPFDDGPPGPVDPIHTLVDFEINEGTFSYSPTYSGSNIGIQGGTADRVTTEAHNGIGSQRISITKDPASPSWMLRHVSGAWAAPSNNVPIDAQGYIGFWLKTDTPGVSVQIGLDDYDGLSADLATLTPVIADGEWHLYQWDLDAPDQWHPWVNVGGDGTITGPTFTMDGLFFYGNSDATIYLDDVAFNNSGTLLPPIPGDLNGDGFVGITDLNAVLGAWNQSVTAGDALAGDPSGDGFVGIEDLNLVLGNWNTGTPPANNANIPEPGTLMVLAMGTGALLRRR